MEVLGIRGSVMTMHGEPIYPDAIRPTTFQEGQEFEDFVCLQLAEKKKLYIQNLKAKRFQLQLGENLQGVEIKLDNLCTRTGRLSIEVAEKSKATNPNWIPSGIYRNDNSWLYIQGNREKFWCFTVKQLKRYEVVNKPRREQARGTVLKFYISIKAADDLAEWSIVP